MCPSSFALVTPTLLYPYCYRINQQNFLKTQQQAIQECEQQRTQLVWFQSIDELEEHLIPALASHGLTRGWFLYLPISFDHSLLFQIFGRVEPMIRNLDDGNG